MRDYSPSLSASLAVSILLLAACGQTSLSGRGTTQTPEEGQHTPLVHLRHYRRADTLGSLHRRPDVGPPPHASDDPGRGGCWQCRGLDECRYGCKYNENEELRQY